MIDGMKPLVIKQSNPKTEFEVGRGKKNLKFILNGDNKSTSSKALNVSISDSRPPRRGARA